MRSVHFKPACAAVLLVGAALSCTSCVGLAIRGGEKIYDTVKDYHSDSSKDEGEAATQTGSLVQDYNGREMHIYIPSQLPALGTRALVVVLHGGLGNADHIASSASSSSERSLNMNAAAEKNGFIVAYLSGTQAMLLGSNMLAWNAGGECCGQPFKNNVDDIGYIKGAVDFLIEKYGVDRHRVYGMGHSNGAMMTQLLMCTTDLYAATMPISGPLQIKTDTCPSARGKHILAIHGVNDGTVPVAGGQGNLIIASVSFNSEDYTSQVYARSGAYYTLDLVKNADHNLNTINSTLQQTEGMSIPDKAVWFFGLSHGENKPSKP